MLLETNGLDMIGCLLKSKIKVNFGPKAGIWEQNAGFWAGSGTVYRAIAKLPDLLFIKLNTFAP